MRYELREKRLLILCFKAERFPAHSQVIVIKRYKNLYFAIFSDTTHIPQFAFAFFAKLLVEGIYNVELIYTSTI